MFPAWNNVRLQALTHRESSTRILVLEMNQFSANFSGRKRQRQVGKPAINCLCLLLSHFRRFRDKRKSLTAAVPGGKKTFLFTDIEGGTKKWGLHPKP